MSTTEKAKNRSDTRADSLGNWQTNTPNCGSNYEINEISPILGANVHCTDMSENPHLIWHPLT